MKTISRADVAWYILNLAEDPPPDQPRTPSSPPPPAGETRPPGNQEPRHVPNAYHRLDIPSRERS